MSIYKIIFLDLDLKFKMKQKLKKYHQPLAIDIIQALAEFQLRYETITLFEI